MERTDLARGSYTPIPSLTSLAFSADLDDIVGAIAFLASDDARFVTGVNLPVDGGLTASTGQPRLS